MGKDFLFTSESVTEGHPDKMADQISDAVLDGIIELDPRARVACETLLKTGMAVIAGEITTSSYVSLPNIVRNTIKKIGYDDGKLGLDWETCAVLVAIEEQSPDIAMGVNDTSDHEQGAGDQGLMFGYACDDTPDLMPMPIDLSHRLAKRLAEVRKEKVLDFLGPDGKTQVTIAYKNDAPVEVQTIVVSSQHNPYVTNETIREGIIEEVIKKTVPVEFMAKSPVFHVNPTGRFVIGGPRGDSGLTGRKIIVDTYGGWGRHGGGAFSGKDPSKVDRSASYMARHVAKNIVAAGLAKRCEVQIAYAIGIAEPVSVMVDTFGTARVDEDKISKAVRAIFPLKPAGIIKYLDLLKPIFLSTASYGHFGFNTRNKTWEQTNKAEELKAAVKA